MPSDIFLAIDFTFDEEFEVYLPTPYLVKNNGGSWYFFKQANALVLKNHPEVEISSEVDKLLETCQLLQKNKLTDKFLKVKNKLQTVASVFADKGKKKYILDYIEDKNHQLLNGIVENSLPMSVDANKQKPFYNQNITFSSEVLQPLLRFKKEENGISYRLSLHTENSVCIPCNESVQLISQKYPWVVWNQSLYRLESISGNKIKPFLTKEEVFVSEVVIPTYFEKFLKKILKKVSIESEGFEVEKYSNLSGYQLVLVFDFFAKAYKLDIQFEYQNYHFRNSNSKKSHSVMNTEDISALKIIQYERNSEQEQKIIEALISIGFEEQDGLFYAPSQPTQWSTLDFIKKHQNVLENEGFDISVLEIESQKLLWETPQIQSIENTQTNDWFDIQIQVLIGEYRIPFNQIIPNIRSGNRLFSLSEGECFIIPEEWFSKYEKLAKFGVSKGEKIQVSKTHYALLEALPEVNSEFLEEITPFEPSPYLKATLRPYQRAGAEWLWEHYQRKMGACLADDMGLGKTLQTLAVLSAVRETLPNKSFAGQMQLFEEASEEKEPLRALVVMPSSLVFNWYDEAKKFTPHLKCLQYVGNQRKLNVRRLSNYDLIFTSYPIVSRDISLLQKHSFRYVILDESQRIKNRNSKTFKSINALQTEVKISLSGTPIENSLSDLWSQMQFINPNILGSYRYFTDTFKNPIEKAKDEKVLEELKTIISPFLLRRTKEQVLDDLPDMTQQTLYCEMSSEQKRWYEKEKSKARNQLLNINLKEASSRINILNTLMKLRQLSNHPQLVDEHSTVESGKYEEVVSQLEIIAKSQKKALIFSSFISHLNIYQRWCEENDYPYVTLTGQTPSQERKTMVDSFQNDEKVPFFFISLKAGEVGLNLTKASYVLLLDPWWNPFSEKQAIGRAHRIGQKNKVTVLRFVSKDTIEEKIQKLQQEKLQLSEELIEESQIVSQVIADLPELL